MFVDLSGLPHGKDTMIGASSCAICIFPPPPFFSPVLMVQTSLASCQPVPERNRDTFECIVNPSNSPPHPHRECAAAAETEKASDGESSPAYTVELAWANATMCGGALSRPRGPCPCRPPLPSLLAPSCCAAAARTASVSAVSHLYICVRVSCSKQASRLANPHPLCP